MRDFFQELRGIGIDPDAPQGTGFWHSLRLGVVTASKASCIASKPDTATFKTYLLENLGEVCTKKQIDSGSAKPMEWGKKHEREARDAYEMVVGKVVTEVPFIYKDESRRFGCSPDGLMLDEQKGVEIKCPFTNKVHLDFILNGEIKKEYILQVQFSMWVTGYKQWDFVSFDPRMPKKRLHVMTMSRCEKTMKMFDEAAKIYVDKTDKALEELGFTFGEQWGIELPKKEAPKQTENPPAQTKTLELDLDLPF